jgi:alpha/beta superfamily hydrolase
MTPTEIALVILWLAPYAFGAWRFAKLREELREIERSLTSSVKTLNVQLFQAVKAHKESSPVVLGAQVAELADAVERLRKIQQRMQGRMDQRRQRDDDVDDNSPEAIRYRALLAAQAATRNGGA